MQYGIGAQLRYLHVMYKDAQGKSCKSKAVHGFVWKITAFSFAVRWRVCDYAFPLSAKRLSRLSPCCWCDRPFKWSDARHLAANVLITAQTCWEEKLDCMHVLMRVCLRLQHACWHRTVSSFALQIPARLFQPYNLVCLLVCVWASVCERISG